MKNGQTGGGGTTSCTREEETSVETGTNFCIRNVVKCTKFGVDHLRGFGMGMGQISPSSIALYLRDVGAGAVDVNLLHSKFSASVDVVAQEHLSKGTGTELATTLPALRRSTSYGHIKPPLSLT